MFRIPQILNVFSGLEKCLGRRKKTKMVQGKGSSPKTITCDKSHAAQKISTTTTTAARSTTPRQSTPWDGKLMQEFPLVAHSRMSHMHTTRAYRRHLFRGKKNKDYRTYPVFDDGDDDQPTEARIDHNRRIKVVEDLEGDLGNMRLDRGTKDGREQRRDGSSDSPWDNPQFGKFGKQDEPSEQKPAKAWTGLQSESGADPWLKNAW